MPPSSCRGQASVDYVAVLSLVAAALAIGAAVAGAPWLAPRVVAEIRHGICVVSGSLCTPEAAARAGLEPCAVHRRSNAERAGVTAVVHLGRDDALLVERRSDGTAAVSFADGWRLGAELGVGIATPGARGSVTGGAGASFTRGRSYEFGDWASARRFLARFAREETLTGEGRELMRDVCPLCRPVLGDDDPRMPRPDVRYTEGGAYADLLVDLGLSRDAALGGRGGSAAILGRRTAGRRETTYIRLGSGAAASLGAVLGSLSAAQEAQVVLEISREGGRPVELRARSAAGIAFEGDLAGSSLDLADVAARIRGATARAREAGDTGGLALEASAALDLADPANRAALVAILRPGSPQGLADGLRALGRRIDVGAAYDLAVVRTTRSADEHAVGGAGGVRVGGAYGRTETTRELLAAWALAAGGPLRRREDCLAPGS